MNPARPVPSLLAGVGQGGAPWRRLLPTLLAACLLLLIPTAPSAAEDGLRGSLWEGTYVGLLAGDGRFSNAIVDVDGFANWGRPGSTLHYDAGAGVVGALAGRRLEFRGVSLLYELEWMQANPSARTDALDPTCADEVAASRLHWTLAARFGVADRIGAVRVFTVAGPALARITNSVTDTDFQGSCLERQLRFDPDDSFHSESTRHGWTLGFGFETDITPNWRVRLDGAYFDFGAGRYRVNRSGNNRCGPGGPQAPCTYSTDNRLTALRVAVIYRFGP